MKLVIEIDLESINGSKEAACMQVAQLLPEIMGFPGRDLRLPYPTDIGARDELLLMQAVDTDKFSSGDIIKGAPTIINVEVSAEPMPVARMSEDEVAESVEIITIADKEPEQ